MTPAWTAAVTAVVMMAVVLVLIRLSTRWPAAARLSALTVLAIGGWYLWWRATDTLVLEPRWAAVVSVGLFLAECYGWMSVAFFYFQTWSPLYRSAPPPPAADAWPTIDVYVTIFDEPLEVLYRTLVGCMAMRAPEGKKRIYVLDDGRRPEVREMTERLGCEYMSRPTNDHAKAGNLNHALHRTRGDLIVNFDTDHVPVETLLERTVGYFQDPAVALVQIAHHFYNPDPYQENLRLTREMLHEQELFFFQIQPGRDRYNAAFYCGTGGLLRRSALEAIGGFLTSTTTEDIHTSIRLHAAGYRSVYVSERLAAGLSAESFESYLKQRERWAQGHAQILFTRESPLWVRGLTVAQRLNYLASISYFYLGLPRLIFLAAPLSYLLFGHPPLTVDSGMLAAHLGPYYLASLLVFTSASGRYRNPFWSEVYETAVCFAVTAATMRAFLHPRLVTFYVTPKGVRRIRSKMGKNALPHFVLAAALLVGLILGGLQVAAGRGDTQAAIVSLFWGVYNLLLLSVALVIARQRPQLRDSPRLTRHLTARVHLNGQRREFPVLDISETGVSLAAEQPLRLPPSVVVTLHNGLQEETVLNARVVRHDRQESGRSFVGLEFSGMSEAQHQSLVRQMYSAPDAWTAPPAAGGIWPSLMLLLTAGLRAFLKEMVVRRFSPRVRRELRCDLHANGWRLKTLTEDIGLNGLCLRLQEPLPAGVQLERGPVQLVIYPGDGREVRCGGDVIWARPDRVRPTAGIVLTRYDPAELERIIRT
ncbi:MAG TPA: PilZ domain-containing protein [Nitrospiria bacterium]|nr:PilZ domain-containing protein [Nitrospiria bacterium]